MSLLLKIFCLVCAIGSNEPARILAVYPVPSISHQVVFRPLMQELAKRGHEVVVITADPAFPKGQSPQNLTEIDVHDLSYKIWNYFLETGKAQAHMTHTQVNIFLDMILNIFEAQIKSEEVQKLLNDKERSFDLLFVEFCVRPALIFAYRYNVPVIEFSSLGGVFGTFDGTGASTNFLLYPLPLRQRVYNLSLWEKISEVYNDYMIEKISDEHVNIENKIVRGVFGPKVPSLSELKKQVQLIFLNVNPIWDFNRPVPPNIIYLGGIHQKPEKQLPEDLKNYLDSSKNGVIYMSFGTNARPSLLPAEKLKIFTNVFSQLPYDILWKWDTDEPPARLENVKISKWLPQSDLLKHPKVKLFITQGGIQSTDEALTAGVPLIVIPFLSDRLFNAEQYELDIGIYLDMETITEAKLINAIKFTIQNNTYRDNVVKLQLPTERTLWWIEYVLRHGGVIPLRSKTAHTALNGCYSVADILMSLPAVIAAVIVTVFVVRSIPYFVQYLRKSVTFYRTPERALSMRDSMK
ncbi:UDP-glycosyltransferase UGT5-like isoform X2 [Maniola hyperantus]|uniref:UDP-glycosyltransferase UGT5-like isoform X2 n=1 Tax=Aphantopus hyperantus TaxID=2795564 RepID=UPI003747B62C